MNINKITTITEQDWQPILAAFGKGDFDKVLTLSEHLISKFPNFAFAYKSKSVALYNTLYKLNQQEQSIIYLKKAYYLDNNDLDTINNLTTALSRSNEKTNWIFAKNVLENSIYEKKHFDIKTYFNLLVCNGRLGKWDKILELANFLLNCIQQNNSALNNNEISEIYSLLYQTKFRQERYNEAEHFAYLMRKYCHTAEADLYVARSLYCQRKHIETINFCNKQM